MKLSKSEAGMLGQKNALATVAVKDLGVARKFYEGTLGLNVAGPTGPEVLMFESGSSKILVYKSQFAGTNQATAVTWPVGEEMDAIVRDLKAKGVAFEKYDFPGVTHDGDVHVFGKMRNAWFKDPDGNILNVVNG
jgi:catechol 2,3-dioxygenase-like lactoylglutathione lyase family enzyme